jgi:hypothetical protein
MAGERLPGGNTGGAVRVGSTVRRAAGPWTPAVQAVLAHLAGKGFAGSPRPLGRDDQGREVLSFLPGETVGDRRPWPAWTHAEPTLDQVARWLRSYHDAIADFVPPPDAVWREGGRWRPGLVVGHNDAAPYNAVWTGDTLVGFIDWDFAAPVEADWDLAFTAFSWVPLHARHVVAAEGFADFPGRGRRLRRLLDCYGHRGDPAGFVDVVRARAAASATGIRRLAASGDPVFGQLLARGVAADLDDAVTELAGFRP